MQIIIYKAQNGYSIEIYYSYHAGGQKVKCERWVFATWEETVTFLDGLKQSKGFNNA